MKGISINCFLQYNLLDFNLRPRAKPLIMRIIAKSSFFNRYKYFLKWLFFLLKLSCLLLHCGEPCF
jgi:hypothetical protein